jgi:putative ABC transport system permease protein
MFRNYLTIAIRHISRQKAYSFINIFGLAFGIGACILIMLYIQNELSYDKHLADHDRIYRVSRAWHNVDGEVNLHLGHVAPPFGPLLKMDYEGQMEQVVRMLNYQPLMSVPESDKIFEEDNFFFADPEFSEVFSWRLIQGDRDKLLVDPYSVVLTESAAKKYFGAEDPMGKSLNFDNSIDLKVTGILEDIPTNSHLHPSMFAPMVLVAEYYGGMEQFMSAWGSNNFATYIKFAEGVDVDEFEPELAAFIDKHFDPGDYGKASEFNKLHLMKVTDIHLHSHLDSEIEQNGDIAYIYLFGIIAAFILLIACINYINLATARSSGRVREVGVRKVLGAFKSRLVGQFLTESMVITIIALVVGCLFVSLLLPWFNNFSQRTLEFDLLSNKFLMLLLVFITIVTGVLAGVYPAIFLSSFKPAKVLKASNIKTGKGRMRSALVVFQFFVSIVLLIGVGVVNDQLEYVKTKDLGFAGGRVLALPGGEEIMNKYELVRQQLLDRDGIEMVSLSSRIPSGRLLDSQGGSVEVNGDMKALDFRLADVHVDFDFLKTLQIPVIAGRDFSRNLASDSTEAFIINEAAVKAAGWRSSDEAIGKKINYSDRSGYITGVVKDFHFESLKQAIAPIIFMITAGDRGSVVLKLTGENETETIDYLREQWSYLRPGAPFSYYFVDARFDELYEDEERVAELVSYFSIVAVIIGVLGLYGLASFTAEQRFKEIGIRKVMGATFAQILLLLTKGFTYLVIIGFVMAAPVAWYLMDKWLNTFAYHDSINWVSLLLAGSTAIIIAWVTVGVQTWKAAGTNPVDTLRNE